MMLRQIIIAQIENISTAYQEESLTANNAEEIVALIPIQKVLHTIVGLTQTQYISVDAYVY